ncbi:DUF421 domain-containing protein [Qipengyuania atrilutea]|uniref:DUF421 domain-containing protein n=1 Tax=Qipengyuania atrilutea TaxID=2744473 RepID=A0A850H9C8_9SPHN|nr:YetF domain-containing protein [Actirhodobacter atriluteus]NVD45905.1 DUF421 domain-containing protein [Actirhodobacter atriluteus]
MIFELDWLDHLARGIILGSLGILYVVVLVRILGLRSFSKMTSFDFVMTVAMGSLVAGGAQATDWLAFLQVIAGMTGLFIIQFVLARARKASDTVENAIQNEPLLLMRNGEFCPAALEASRVTRADVIAKLREANVMNFSEIRAVVLETTGDVSVMHGDRLQDELIQDVRQKN